MPSPINNETLNGAVTVFEEDIVTTPNYTTTPPITASGTLVACVILLATLIKSCAWPATGTAEIFQMLCPYYLTPANKLQIVETTILLPA